MLPIDFIVFCRRGFILENFAVKTAPTNLIKPATVKYNRTNNIYKALETLTNDKSNSA